MFPSGKNIDGSNIDLTNYYTKTEVNAIVNSQGRAYIPCGSVQAFMTTTAPQGYLICDGTEYLKTQYPQLAEVLAAVDTAQETTLFVGSDADHFKVPDLRGEFLRGTGTNSHTNQGSGANVGVHQNGSETPTISSWSNNLALLQMKYPTGSETSNFPKYQDSWIPEGSDYSYLSFNGQYNHQTIENKARFTTRPTNTSVLYCIAYQDLYSVPLHQYSTEEHVVGTWIDGKTLYEKTYDITRNLTISPEHTYIQHNISNLDKVCNSSIVFYPGWNNTILGSHDSYLAALGVAVRYDSTNIVIQNTSSTVYKNSRLFVTIKYTKTTDV